MCCKMYPGACPLVPRYNRCKREGRWWIFRCQAVQQSSLPNRDLHLIQGTRIAHGTAGGKKVESLCGKARIFEVGKGYSKSVEKKLLNPTDLRVGVLRTFPYRPQREPNHHCQVSGHLGSHQTSASVHKSIPMRQVQPQKRIPPHRRCSQNVCCHLHFNARIPELIVATGSCMLL